MKKIKPKDIDTKHKADDYIYIRSREKISPEYTIRRVQITEIIITIKENTVDIRYDIDFDIIPESQTYSTITEAEEHAIAELAAYKLKSKDNSEYKKKKPKLPVKKKSARRRRRRAVADEDNDVKEEEMFSINDDDDEDEVNADGL